MPFFFRIIAISMLLLPFLACPPVAPEDCKSNDDCLKGQVCCEGADKKKSCKTGTKCDDKCAGTTACTKATDCSSGEECKSGCCATVASGQKCKKHLDCPKGNDCIPSGSAKKCLACALPCVSVTDCTGAKEECENGCCRLPSCKADADCKDREGKNFCHVETGECVACLKSEECQKKDEQSVCRNNRCAKVECTLDRHCTDPNRSTCNKETFRCVPSPVCVTDKDCTSDPDLNRCDPGADGGRGACKKGNCIPCSTDDDCGGNGDFCVGADKGLKDGKRCLRACKEAVDCPTGFICSDKVVNGFKICFPRIEYCVDPCSQIKCKDEEVCVEGQCKPKPKPCNPCKQGDTSSCEPGAQCLPYSGGKFFCGRSCKNASDCPTDRKYQCLNSQCLALDECK